MLESFAFGLLVASVPLAPQGAQDLPGQFSGRSFLDFSASLDRVSTVVVIATLPKVIEGKRDRMKENEGQLGDGGRVMSVSGTVFYKVTATAKLAVAKALSGTASNLAGTASNKEPAGAKDAAGAREPAGTKEQSLPVSFDLQWTKLPSGEVQRHLLLTPRVPLEDGMLALFVLEADKGSARVVQVLRADPKQETSAAFQARAEDVYAINRWMSQLRSAFDSAKAQMSKDRQGAAAKLEKALASKPKLQAEQSDSLLTMHAGPSEKRVLELKKELEHEKH